MQEPFEPNQEPIFESLGHHWKLNTGALVKKLFGVDRRTLGIGGDIKNLELIVGLRDVLRGVIKHREGVKESQAEKALILELVRGELLTQAEMFVGKPLTSNEVIQVGLLARKFATGESTRFFTIAGGPPAWFENWLDTDPLSRVGVQEVGLEPLPGVLQQQEQPRQEYIRFVGELERWVAEQVGPSPMDEDIIEALRTYIAGATGMTEDQVPVEYIDGLWMDSINGLMETPGMFVLDPDLLRRFFVRKFGKQSLGDDGLDAAVDAEFEEVFNLIEYDFEEQTLPDLVEGFVGGEIHTRGDIIFKLRELKGIQLDTNDPKVATWLDGLVKRINLAAEDEANAQVSQATQLTEEGKVEAQIIRNRTIDALVNTELEKYSTAKDVDVAVNDTIGRAHPDVRALEYGNWLKSISMNDADRSLLSTSEGQAGFEQAWIESGSDLPLGDWLTATGARALPTILTDLQRPFVGLQDAENRFEAFVVAAREAGMWNTPEQRAAGRNVFDQMEAQLMSDPTIDPQTLIDEFVGKIPSLDTLEVEEFMGHARAAAGPPPGGVDVQATADVALKGLAERIGTGTLSTRFAAKQKVNAAKNLIRNIQAELDIAQQLGEDTTEIEERMLAAQNTLTEAQSKVTTTSKQDRAAGIDLEIAMMLRDNPRIARAFATGDPQILKAVLGPLGIEPGSIGDELLKKQEVNPPSSATGETAQSVLAIGMEQEPLQFLNIKRDEQGQQIFKTDAQGQPILDEDGQKIPVTELVPLPPPPKPEQIEVTTAAKALQEEDDLLVSHVYEPPEPVVETEPEPVDEPKLPIVTSNKRTIGRSRV